MSTATVDTTELIDVEMPDGTIISGVPKGITQAEVQRRYQASRKASPPTDMRPGTDVAKDQALAAAKGAISPITGLPEQIQREGIFKTLANNLTPVAIAKGLWGGVKAVGEDVIPNIVRNAEALRQAYGGPAPTFGSAPTREENEKAASTAGAAAGGLAVAEGIAKVAPKLTPTPDSLMLRAAENRANAVAASLPSSTAPGAMINAVIKATALPRAVVEEWMARKLALLEPKRPIASLSATHEPVGDIVSPSNPKIVAADEASRIAQAPIPGRARAAAEQPLHIQRPQVPQFIQDTLDRFRAMETPEEKYAREQAIRNQDIPPESDENAAVSEATTYRPPPDTGLPAMTTGSLDAPSLNRAMNISEKQVARGANPGQRVLSEKLLASTPEATKIKVDAALVDSAARLQSALKTAGAKGVTIDAQNLVQDALEGATKRIGTPKDVSFQGQLNGVLDDILKRYPGIDTLSPEQAHALKVELGDAISWSGTAYDSPINRAMVRIYSELNAAIKNSVEGIGAEQSRWGDLYNASKGLKKTLDRSLVGKSLWNKFTGQ